MKIIDIQNIKREFKLGDELIQALKGVDLQIQKNEYVALMGPSGSGKSTLMNILGCLDTPSSGQYLLNNIDVSSMNDNDLATIRNKQIGFVFQTFNLIPRLSTLDNVALPLVYAGWNKSKREERAKEVLEQVGLGERLQHKPNELSGGQRQRVAVARALVTNPSIILADEPTGELDSQTGQEVFQYLRELATANQATVIVVTHDASYMQPEDAVHRIRDGQLVETITGKPD